MTAADIYRCRKVLATLFGRKDDTVNEQQISAGWDAGMVALNTLRGETTTAAIELLLEASRLSRPRLVSSLSSLLRSATASTHAVPIHAAIGIRLPWLLAQDRANRAEVANTALWLRRSRLVPGCLLAGIFDVFPILQ